MKAKACEEIIDYISDIQGLKKVKRYGAYDKAFEDSVAEHCYAALVLGLKLIERFKLTLDFEKVVHAFLFHDIGELGLEYDFDAHSVARDKKLGDKKTEYETKAVSSFAKRHGLPWVVDFNKDYRNHATAEARFVYAVDKLENTIHMLNVKGIELQNREGCLAYCDKATAAFGELEPFVNEVKRRVAERFDKEEGK